MRHRHLTAVAVAAAAAALALTGCASSGAQAGVRVLSTPDTDGYHGTVLDVPYARPSVVFTDTTGKPYRLDRDATRPVTLVFFGYTHCPDVCNTVLADLASALRRMDPSLRGRTQVVFITTDPERDSAPVIRDYLDRFDPAFVGLTGSQRAIEQAAGELGVALTGKEGAGPDYEVGHGAQVIGFGPPDGRGRLIWMPDTPVGDLRADLSRLASQT